MRRYWTWQCSQPLKKCYYVIKKILKKSKIKSSQFYDVQINVKQHLKWTIFKLRTSSNNKTMFCKYKKLLRKFFFIVTSIIVHM